MTIKTQEKIERMREFRDRKAIPHLEQYAPVWIVNEEPIPDEETIRFNVVFYHPRYGWVNRRYRYDAFDNVLYHMGQRKIEEDDALYNLTEKPPYITAETINTVDSYGG